MTGRKRGKEREREREREARRTREGEREQVNEAEDMVRNLVQQPFFRKDHTLQGVHSSAKEWLLGCVNASLTNQENKKA